MAILSCFCDLVEFRGVERNVLAKVMMFISQYFAKDKEQETPFQPFSSLSNVFSLGQLPHWIQHVGHMTKNFIPYIPFIPIPIPLYLSYITRKATHKILGQEVRDEKVLGNCARMNNINRAQLKLFLRINTTEREKEGYECVFPASFFPPCPYRF